MNAMLLYPVILAAGALQAFGNSMNAELKNSLLNPWLASLVSFVLIVAVFLIIFAVFPRPLPTIEQISATPWWAPIGGIAGAFAVFAGLVLVNKIGAGPFNGLIITANILTSLLIDHYGLFNMPTHEMNWPRALGGALMMAGITLISLY